MWLHFWSLANRPAKLKARDLKGVFEISIGHWFTFRDLGWDLVNLAKVASAAEVYKTLAH
jgi:hypothetical protein